MKIRNFIFSILSFAICSSSLLFLSCTGENESISIEDTAAITVYKTTNVLPFNDNNAYDFAGTIHNQILSAYYQSENLPTGTRAILERVDSIAVRNHNFYAIKDSNYDVPELGRIEDILSDKITCATAVITSTDITITAKSSLSNFASALFAFSTTEDDYAVIYSFIVDYEHEVTNNKIFTNADKELILTVSSIARHTIYAKKKRPKKNMDPDWDVLVSNIIASIDGARFGQAEAIVSALTAGIAENPK